jgi:Ca-activated chloride channel family protein
MRSCKRFEKMLPGYLHGELYEKEYHALQAHLKQCASCRDELEAQQMTLQLAGRSLATAPVPVRLTARRSFQAKNVETRQALAQKILHSLQFKVVLAVGAAAMLLILSLISIPSIGHKKMAGAIRSLDSEFSAADSRMEEFSGSRSSESKPSAPKLRQIIVNHSSELADTVTLSMPKMEGVFAKSGTVIEMDLGNYDDALASAEPRSVEQSLKKGVKLYQSGQYADAKESFKDVLGIDANNPEALDYLSRTYARADTIEREKRYLARNEAFADVDARWEMPEETAVPSMAGAIVRQDNVSIVNHWDFEDNSAAEPEGVERPKMSLKKPIVKAASKPKPASRIVAKVKMSQMPEINIPDLTGSGDALLSNTEVSDDFSGGFSFGVPAVDAGTVNGQSLFAKTESYSRELASDGTSIDGKYAYGNTADMLGSDYVTQPFSRIEEESVNGMTTYIEAGSEVALDQEISVVEGNLFHVGYDDSKQFGAAEGWSENIIANGKPPSVTDYDTDGLADAKEIMIINGTITNMVDLDFVPLEYARGIIDENSKVTIMDAIDDELVVPPAAREPAEYNPYVMAAENAFSTFSIDVDTASYGLARSQIFSGVLPEPESVRTEEFVNSFDYDYRPPAGAQTFSVYNEMAPSPFRSRMEILKVGVKGRRIGRDDHRGAVLTLVVDTSGSMSSPERIGLVKQSLGLLLDQLNPSDKVAIVQFGGDARLVSEHTPVSEKEALLAAIDALQPGGPTQFDKGLELGYQVAVNAFQAGDSNRIIIMSDGVANLGELEPDAILNQVEAYRKKGIYLSVLGFGAGTYDDHLLESLANRGDGAYAYVDTIDEARHLFVDQLAATLHVIASDVKIQVEFNPKRVVRYRQIGYENRQLTQEQFRDDSVDAGEVGSGQSVTALYEVELALEVAPRDPIATVYVRYRRTDNQAIEEINSRVTDASRVDQFEEASPRFRLAACVAEFAERLRCSPYADGTEMINIIERLQPVAAALDLDGQVQELLQLISMTRMD